MCDFIRRKSSGLSSDPTLEGGRNTSSGANFTFFLHFKIQHLQANPSPRLGSCKTHSALSFLPSTFTVRRCISLVDCTFPVRNGVFPFQTGKIRLYFPCQDQYFPYETGKIPVFSRLARVFQLAGVFSLLVSYCFSIVNCTNTFWQLFILQ
jgi:hypothetical protein